MALLNHPNVVTVHDVGTVGDSVFVAMELVEGQTLSEWFVTNAPSRSEALEVMMAAGWGLDAAHKAGLVHRDFKPENVIVGQNGVLRVIDFGLARAGVTGEAVAELTSAEISELEEREAQRFSVGKLGFGPSDNSVASSSECLLDVRMTQHGSILGTPFYMAPEQFFTADVDARADQYSFCIVLCEALYSRSPFTKASLRELGRYLKHGEARREESARNVPSWLAAIVRKGLSRDPGDRYESLDALLEALSDNPEEELRQQRLARRRRIIGLSVLGSLVVVTVLALALRAHHRAEIRAECVQGSDHPLVAKGDKGRAVELAHQAREIFTKKPKTFEKKLEEVDAWLQEHAGRTR